MANKNQFTGRDAFYRMKYLHQIADMCRQKSGDDYTKLMLYYGSQLVSIGKKTQSRMSPVMKRTMCKVCNAILVPGDTEKIRLIKNKRQPDKMKSICVLCGSEKVFNLRKDYQLWCEKPESIVKIIDTGENNKPSIKSRNKNDSKGESSKSNLKIDKSSIDDLKKILNFKKNSSDAKSSATFEHYSDKNKALNAKLIKDNINNSKNNVECKYKSSNVQSMVDAKSSKNIDDLKNIVTSGKKNTFDINLPKDSTISDLKDIVNSRKVTSGGNLSKTSDVCQKNIEKVDSCEHMDSALMEIDEISNGHNSNGNQV